MRLFLAVPLPESLRSAAAAAAAGLALDRRAWRFVGEGGLHLTIVFFGEVEAERRVVLDAVCRSAAGGSGVLPLTLRSAGSFPRGGLPQVVWLGIEDRSRRALAELAARMARATREAGFPSDARPFRPHVTIARVRSGVRALRPDTSRVGVLGEFAASHVTLFRSELGTGGARYLVESVYPLAARTVA